MSPSSSHSKFWTYDRIQQAIEIIKTCSSREEAAKALSKKWHKRITVDMIKNALSRHGYYSMGEYLSTAKTKKSGKMHPYVRTNTNNTTNDFQENIQNLQSLISLLTSSKRPLRLKEISEALHISQKATRDLFSLAKAAGHDIHISKNMVSLEHVPQDKPVRLNTAMDKDWHVIAAMSDLHIGSRHCLEEEIANFVYKAASMGVKDILIPGDLFEGNLRHHGFQFELKCLGYDEQATLLLSVLPRIDGVTYHYCDGNHEINSWFKTIGMQPGKALQRDALAIGRTDFNYLGPITGRILLSNDGDPDTDIKVELSHTEDRKAYAISYPIQKHIENIPIGAKPHLLLKAHLHQYSKIDVRGVVAIQTGCFKGRGYFEEAKNIHPQIGGVIIWMRRKGRNFDIRDQWCAVRPKPLIWTNISK